MGILPPPRYPRVVKQPPKINFLHYISVTAVKCTIVRKVNTILCPYLQTMLKCEGCCGIPPTVSQEIFIRNYSRVDYSLTKNYIGYPKRYTKLRLTPIYKYNYIWVSSEVYCTVLDSLCSFWLNGNPRARLIAGYIFLATPSGESPLIPQRRWRRRLANTTQSRLIV